MSDFFKIKKPVEGFYKDKGSKFLSFCHNVTNRNEIDEVLTSLRTKYHDARHHCYAWQLGTENIQIRVNDDGEPNHSAGDPIMGQIRSFNLTNIVIVVVRYFGGTKLGISGLIDAYKTAAKDALQKASLIKIIPLTSFSIVFNYDQTSIVERILHPFQLNVEKEFTERCKFIIKCQKEDAPELINKFSIFQDIQLKKS